MIGLLVVQFLFFPQLIHPSIAFVNQNFRGLKNNEIMMKNS